MEYFKYRQWFLQVMKDHHATALQGAKGHLGDYLTPINYDTLYRLGTINDLWVIRNNYDLHILDADCTLQECHGNRRVQDFERVLNAIARRSEIASNSSFDRMRELRDVFGDIMPISKLVHLKHSHRPILLRFEKGLLHAYDIIGSKAFDVTGIVTAGDTLVCPITHHYKKPDPEIIHSIITVNKELGRIPEKPSVVMVGDRYLTDIVAGNLAGVDTALVKPFMPLSDSWDLILMRYLVDKPFGGFMNWLARVYNPSANGSGVR